MKSLESVFEIPIFSSRLYSFLMMMITSYAIICINLANIESEWQSLLSVWCICFSTMNLLQHEQLTGLGSRGGKWYFRSTSSMHYFKTCDLIVRWPWVLCFSAKTEIGKVCHFCVLKDGVSKSDFKRLNQHLTWIAP